MDIGELVFHERGWQRWVDRLCLALLLVGLGWLAAAASGQYQAGGVWGSPPPGPSGRIDAPGPNLNQRGPNSDLRAPDGALILES